jgi:two-component system, NarL family, response regulator DevR
VASTTVLIADHEQARRGRCRRLLQGVPTVRVVGEARNVPEALVGMAEWKPDVLLLDLNLVQANAGFPVARLLRKSPRTRIILLTHHAAETQILDALSQGARGFLPKAALVAYLAKAVPAVDAGEAWVPRTTVASLLARLGRRASQA